MEDKNSEIEKAKELLAKVEQQQLESAQKILKEAFDKVNQLGFKVEIAGSFKGNKFETSMLLEKK